MSLWMARPQEGPGCFLLKRFLFAFLNSEKSRLMDTVPMRCPQAATFCDII